MTAASDYFEAKVLDDYFVNGPTFLALFPADPGETNTTTDQIGTRKQATFTRTGNRVTFAADVLWSSLSATEDISVGSVAVMDAATGGHTLVHGKLTMPEPDHPGQTIEAPPKLVPAGDAFLLPAGSVAVLVD